MKIRLALPQDASQVAMIWNAEIRDAVSTFNSIQKTDADIVAQITERGPAFLVAEQGEEVIGFATYFPFRGGVGYAHTKENTVYIAPQARGFGAGQRLMLTLMDNAKLDGVHTMMAAIGGENEAGVRFHSAIGFKHVARVPEAGYKFDRWMDLILMQKFL